MGIIKISGIEKGEIDAIARRRLLSALRYNLSRSDLEEVIEAAYKCYCDRKEEKERDVYNRMARRWEVVSGPLI